MVISINNQCFNREEYKDEKELQEYIEKCPNLLFPELYPEQEPEITLIKTDANLPSICESDLLLVDNSGSLIFVGIYFTHDTQSLFDFFGKMTLRINDLSEMKLEQFDDLLEGSLRQAISSFNTGIDLWKKCEEILQSQNVKVIAVANNYTEDLYQGAIGTPYIFNHDDLPEYKILTIDKYQNGRVLIPKTVEWS